MLLFVVRRLIFSLPIVFFLSLIVFALVHLTPGDPLFLLFAGEQPPPEVLAEMRRQLGLDLPLHEQYARWLLKCLRGDLGASIRTGQPVSEAILARVPITLQLSLFAMVFAIIVSAAVGVLATLWRSRWLDTLTTTLVLSGVAIPHFFLALVLILVFAQWLNWLPAVGYIPISVSLAENLRHMILPTITLGMGLALIPRMTHVTITSALRREFVTVARAKGLPESLIIRRHALPNALVPIISVISLETGALLGGVVLTEVIFAIPGLGRLVVENILARDYPLVQGTVLVLALTRVAVNLIADILYGVVDPRIRAA